ncbi:MAG: histidinol-phosphate transaminase [Candidatus Altiarchaeota archaeon]|nr:histidinol-phosphate transaminase [Candidatus Altiarchaeota archaeon]
MKYDLNASLKQWIKDLCCYTPGETREGYIKLASNENNYGPSPKVREALLKALSDLNVYPHRVDELRRKIAGYCRVGPESIILGNGSDELLDMIYKTFKGPSLGVNPTYSEYRIFTEALGGEYMEVDLREDYGVPLDEYLRSAKKAGILMICSPNNPTGSVITQEDLERVLEVGKVTVIDEAYAEFHKKTFIPIVKDYDNLIILRTFSKAFALAGLRAGYAVASPEMIEAMNKVKPPFSVNSLAIEAASAALDDAEYMNETVEKIIRGREELYSGLNEKFKAYPSNANFILADTSPKRSRDVYEGFLLKKIIIRNLGRFRNFPGEYVRVTVGTSPENRSFLEALGDL